MEQGGAAEKPEIRGRALKAAVGILIAMLVAYLLHIWFYSQWYGGFAEARRLGTAQSSHLPFCRYPMNWFREPLPPMPPDYRPPAGCYCFDGVLKGPTLLFIRSVGEVPARIRTAVLPATGLSMDGVILLAVGLLPWLLYFPRPGFWTWPFMFLSLAFCVLAPIIDAIMHI